METVFAQTLFASDCLIDCVRSDMRWDMVVERRVKVRDRVGVRQSIDAGVDNRKRCTIMSKVTISNR